MFLLREILFSTPLIIYAGFRIWKLISQRLFKILFIIVYILLVLAFPLAEILSHNVGTGWSKFIRLRQNTLRLATGMNGEANRAEAHRAKAGLLRRNSA